MNPEKNLLLIGGNGYIGSHLADYLSNEYRVFITGRNQSSIKDYFQLNSSDPAFFSSIFSQFSYSGILYLAADTTISSSRKIDLNGKVFSANVCFLHFVLEQLASLNSPPPFYYISSMAVYSPYQELPVNENGVCVPLHEYGLSKLMAEQLVTYYSSNFKLPSAILRLPGIYGGNRNDGFLYQLRKKLSENSDFTVNTENLNFWEPMHIHDLCKTISRLIKLSRSEDICPKFNISYGHLIDLLETVTSCKRILNSISTIRYEYCEYQPFYMDNTRLRKLIFMNDISHEKSLISYLKGEL